MAPGAGRLASLLVTAAAAVAPRLASAGRCMTGEFAGLEAYSVVVKVGDGNLFSGEAASCGGHWSIVREGEVVLFGCKLPGARVLKDGGAIDPHAVPGMQGIDACDPVDNAAGSCTLSQFGDDSTAQPDVKQLPEGTYTFVLQLHGCPYFGEACHPNKGPFGKCDGPAQCDVSQEFGAACAPSVSIRVSDAGMVSVGLAQQFNTTVTYGDGSPWGTPGHDTDVQGLINQVADRTPPGMKSPDVVTTVSATFSIPLDGKSALLPSTCSDDADSRCYFRDPAVCDDVNASATCVGRCSASCREALVALNNTDPPGCQTCTEEQLGSYGDGSGKTDCWKGSCEGPEYQAGYCGVGTCPPGFFCPANYRCKIPCNPTGDTRQDFVHRRILPSIPGDENSEAHYCPSPIPLPNGMCKVDTYYGLVQRAIPAPEGPVGRCPGNVDLPSTVCPAGSMCNTAGTVKKICPEGHWCPPGTRDPLGATGGGPRTCLFWQDCPPGTKSVCASGLEDAFGSCYVVDGLGFLSIVGVVGWLAWRIGSSLKDRSHNVEGRKREDALNRERSMEMLSVRVNPAHRRESSDDGGLLRQTMADILLDIETVAEAGGQMIENGVSNPHPESRGIIGLLESVDTGFHMGLASIRERKEESEGRVLRGGNRALGLGSAIPPQLNQSLMEEIHVEPTGKKRAVSEPLSRRVDSAGGGFDVPSSDGAESQSRARSHGSAYDSPTPRAPIDLRFSEVKLTLKSPLPPTQILRGVTGELKAGRLTAIMGPSGAGKTSFLNVVSGKASAYGTVGGQLLINGNVEPHGISQYKRSVGFVPQEDTMLREMTPKEILTFSAKMRLPPQCSSIEIRRVVDETLDKLNLWKIRHSPVGDEERRGISGGQRKRVNIGMELVADPSVLFLDEPTSGLDSTSSLEVCQILRGLAQDQGINVTAVLHQPRYEIFEMFHDVLLLGPGGVTVYLGPAEQAISYFEVLNPLYRVPKRSNPADFLMDLISGVECGEQGKRVMADDQRHETLAQRWVEHQVDLGAGPDSPLTDRLRASESHLSRISSAGESDSSASSGEGTQHGDTPDHRPRPSDAASGPHRERPVRRKARSVCLQGQLFFWRGLSQTIRPPSKLLIDYTLISIMGLLIGMVFKNTDIQKLPASNNFTSMAVGFTTIQSSLRLFGGERVVFWREAASGASRTAYFLGKNLSDIPRLVLVPAMYLSLFLGFSGVHEHNTARYLSLLMAVWATSGLGYVASTLFSPRNAQLGGVSLTLVCCLLSGFFPTYPESSPIMRTIISCSYARWLNEALWVVDRGSFDGGVDRFSVLRQETAVKWGLEPGYVCVDPVNGPLAPWLEPQGCFTLDDYTGTPYQEGCENQEGVQVGLETNPERCGFNHCNKQEGAACVELGFAWTEVGGHTINDICIALGVIGLVARVVAFALLCGTHRSKQI